MPYAAPDPISAQFGTLAIDTPATYPATTVIPECRNIRFTPRMNVNVYSGSSTAGFARRGAGGVDYSLTFEIYPRGGGSVPLTSSPLKLYAGATGGALVEVPDVTMMRYDFSADNKPYISSTSAPRVRRLKGRKDFGCAFDILAQSGVVIGSPAWNVAGTLIDLEIRRVAAVAFSATCIVESYEASVAVEGGDPVSMALTLGGDGVIGGSGELIFAHAPGDYVSICGMTSATKGIKGYFIIDRITALVDLMNGRLIELSVECSGDGVSAPEAVS
jgi:hypothetical protein